MRNAPGERVVWWCFAVGVFGNTTGILVEAYLSYIRPGYGFPSFADLAYLSLYDNVLTEASRVLDGEGWLLLSMPNLGSYTNRLSLLFGGQPHGVAVSRHREAGKIRRHHGDSTSANMPPLLHSATLRCMREVLDDFGFDGQVVWE